jgi:hypothetical protein
MPTTSAKPQIIAGMAASTTRLPPVLCLVEHLLADEPSPPHVVLGEAPFRLGYREAVPRR